MDGNTVQVVQLTFLKLLSATAKQRFTYMCQNSAGWYDGTSHSYRHALRFRAGNDEELTQAKSSFIYAVYDAPKWLGRVRERLTTGNGDVSPQ